MKKINDLIFKYVLNNAVKVFGVLLLAIITLQIIGRTFMPTPPSWTEEMSRFTFVWYSFLACAVTLREKQHLGLDYFYKKFKPGFAHIVDLVTQGLILVFGAYCLYYGVTLLGVVAKRKAPITGWSMTWFYLVMPIMGALFVLVALENFEELLSKKQPKEGIAE